MVSTTKVEQYQNENQSKQEIKINQNSELITEGACDTVFVDRIVEKIVEKPIYLEAKNNEQSSNKLNSDSEKINPEINSSTEEIIKEKIVYVRDTIYIRDTVYQKVFVKAEAKEIIKNTTDKNTITKEDKENGLTASTKKEVIQTPLENIESNKKEELENNNETQQEEESEFDKQFAVGKTLNLQNIQFEQGTSKLLSKAYEDLEKLLLMLKKYPKMKISLGGHTDNVGLHTVNLRLSGERVRTVQNYLVSHGISRSRIQTRAYAGTYPIASNAEEETRKLNRRVEVTILSK